MGQSWDLDQSSAWPGTDITAMQSTMEQIKFPREGMGELRGLGPF